MSNLISTINIGSIAYAKTMLDSFSYYAKHTNSDLFVLTETKNNYSPHFDKFYIIEQFISSNYDKLLFLDIDVRILKTAENIFDKFTEAAFVLDRENRSFDKYTTTIEDENLPAVQSFKHWVKTTYNHMCTTNYMFNTGVFGLNKNSAKKLFDIYKSEIGNDVKLYLKKYPPGRDYEQSYFNYFLTKSDIKIDILDRRFNTTARWQVENKEKVCSFAHYKNEKHLINTNWDTLRDE